MNPAGVCQQPQLDPLHVQFSAAQKELAIRIAKAGLLRDGHEGDRLIASPVIADEATALDLHRASVEIIAIVLSLADRLFNSSLEALGRWCGFSEENLRYLLIGPDLSCSVAKVLARVDSYRVDRGWKLLEINLGTNVGGQQLDWFHRPYLRQVAQLAGDTAYFDSTELWAGFTAKLFRAAAGTCGHIAMVEGEAGLGDADNVRFMKYLSEALNRASGIRVSICGPRDLVRSGAELMYDGEPVDVIYRVFNFADVKANPAHYSAMFDAVRDGVSIMPMGLHYKLFGNKAIFALLSDPQFRAGFSNTEAGLLDRYIPRTRRLDDAVLGEARHLRETLVLKPATGHGGKGVTVGAECSPGEWTEHLAAALASGKTYIVQERVDVPSANLALLTAGSETTFMQRCRLLHGSFSFGGEFGGLMVRAQPEGEGNLVINYSRGAYMGPALVRSRGGSARKEMQ